MQRFDRTELSRASKAEARRNNHAQLKVHELLTHKQKKHYFSWLHFRQLQERLIEQKIQGSYDVERDSMCAQECERIASWAILIHTAILDTSRATQWICLRECPENLSLLRLLFGHQEEGHRLLFVNFLVSWQLPRHQRHQVQLLNTVNQTFPLSTSPPPLQSKLQLPLLTMSNDEVNEMVHKHHIEIQHPMAC